MFFRFSKIAFRPRRFARLGAWRGAGLFALLVLVAQLPFAKSFAQAGGSDEAQQAHDRLLNQLGTSEAAILSGANAQHESKAEAIQKTAASNSQGAALQDALETIRSLESQQESLIDELVKYKQQAQSASAGGSRPGAMNREMQSLQQELQRERDRARELENQVENLTKEVETNVRSEIDAKAVGERLDKADQISARLERELEAKKNIAADNDYLRETIEKQKERIGELEKSLKQATSSGSNTTPSELQDRLALLAREKRQLQQQSAELNEKLDKDVVLLRQAAEQIRRLKEQTKDSDSAIESNKSELDEARATIEKLKQQLAVAEKNGAALDRANAGLDKAGAQLEENKQKIEQANKELQKTSSELVESRKMVADLRGQIQLLEQDKQQIAATFEKLKASAQGTEAELADTKGQLAKSSEDAKLCFVQLQDKSKIANQLPDVQTNLSETQGKLSATSKELQECISKSNEKDEMLATIPGLRKQLLEAKNQLLLKETEKALISKDSPKPPAEAQAPMVIDKELERQKDRVMESSGLKAGQETVKGRTSVPPPASDVLIVTVRANKVSLRAGPGPEHAPVMEVGRGTTLVVESREGEWYRVIAPNSTRAYIKADLVVIVSGGSAESVLNPNGGVRIPKKTPVRTLPADGNMEPFGDVKGGGSSDPESRAIERLRSKLGEKQ